MHSFTEENYLKAIYKLMEQDGDSPISTNAIAAKINTKAATVTDMLKKLSKKKLINYQKYKGITLTTAGKKTALAIIRKHRLWEVFLVEKLHFKWDEVHDIAEQLEHIHSDKLIEKLDHFLSYPKFDPHGDPIPDSNGNLLGRKSKLLSECSEGGLYVMTGVVDHTPAFLQYLDTIKLSLGDEIKINQITSYDGSLHIVINKKNSLYVSNEVAKNILVSRKT